MADFELIFSAIGLIVGGGALVWNFYNYRQAAIGYMKLKVECISVSNKNKKYLRCKTELENTSRLPIKIFYSFIVILTKPSTIPDVANYVCKEAAEKKKIISNNLFDPKILTYLKESYNESSALKTNVFFLQPLEYYYIQNKRLGSLENLTATYLQEAQSGTYSIYFCVIGEKWINKREKSANRSVYDEIFLN
jgi:hypothetical protein